MQRLKPEILEALPDWKLEKRYEFLKDEPFYYAAYHFPEFFTYPAAPYHYDFADDYAALMEGDIDILSWFAHRESAKTSFAKIFVTHAIAYQKKRFINYDSYDKDNAEAALFDIANWLMTKETLTADYGQMIPTASRKKGDSKTIQRLSKFITTHYDPYTGKPGVGTMCQAFSTQESVRGRVFGARRPDWVIFDDIETNKTKDSRAVTQSIISHFNEARTGLQGGIGSLTVLGNFIIDDGVIGYIMDAYRNNPRAIIRNIPAAKGGKPIWSGKYVMTNKEAAAANRHIEDREEQKISLEAKRTEYGDSIYETEMMNNPSKSGDLFFDRRLVDAAITRAEDPIETLAGLEVWAKYNPKHMYGMGADTSEGIGSDSNSSVIMDFTCKPNLVVATFEDNMLAPNVFGAEIKREARLYSYPYLVPELNASGYATVAELINDPPYPTDQLYQREVRNKTSQKLQKEFGWKATVGTKWEVMGEFKTGFEDGEFIVLDRALLEEMRLFRKSDARLPGRDKGATKHFDKLRAAALAWYARKYITAPVDERKKKFFNIPGQQEPYKP